MLKDLICFRHTRKLKDKQSCLIFYKIRYISLLYGKFLFINNVCLTFSQFIILYMVVPSSECDNIDAI